MLDQLILLRSLVPLTVVVSSDLYFALGHSLVQEFRSTLDERPNGMSDAVAAIKVLLEMIKRSEGMIM